MHWVSKSTKYLRFNEIYQLSVVGKPTTNCWTVLIPGNGTFARLLLFQEARFSSGSSISCHPTACFPAWQGDASCCLRWSARTFWMLFSSSSLLGKASCKNFSIFSTYKRQTKRTPNWPNLLTLLALQANKIKCQSLRNPMVITCYHSDQLARCLTYHTQSTGLGS